MPAATGALDATSNSDADHSSQPSKRDSCPSAFSDTSFAASRRSRPDRDDPEPAAVEAGPRADAAEPVEHVAVVGDEDQLRRLCSPPSGPPKRRSNGSRPGRAARAASTPPSRASRPGTLGLDDLRVDPERDVVDEDPAVDESEVDPALDASTNASSAPTTSSRSSPRSSARWFRVPAGTQTYGRSCSIATWATIACEPSPPAIPITSADACRLVRERPRSSPGSSTIGSIPCGAGLVHQLELLDLAAARLRVHEQDRPAPACSPGAGLGRGRSRRGRSAERVAGWRRRRR